MNQSQTKHSQDCIFPITVQTKNGEDYGNGTIVNGLFITAGHVVKDTSRLSFHYKNHNYKLPLGEALFCEYNDPMSEDGYDICIFKNQELRSNFELAIKPPTIGETLISISYKHIVSIPNIINPKNIFERLSEERFEEKICNAKVVSVEGNFFACQMEEPLEEGRSGSPVLSGNTIVGFLHGGKDSGYYCVFQSASSLNNLITR